MFGRSLMYNKKKIGPNFVSLSYSTFNFFMKGRKYP